MFFLLSLLFWLTQAFAARVDLQVDSREVYSGVPFVLSVMAQDFEEKPEPKVKPFTIPGCTVEFQNMMPSVSTNMTWSPTAGRKIIRDVKYVYNYIVVSQQSGVIETPPITVTQGQTAATVQPQQLRVQSITSSRDMDIVFGLPNRNLKAGETVPFTLDIFLRAKAQDQQIAVPLFELSEQIRVQPDQAGQDQTLSIQTAGGIVEFPYTHDEVQHKGLDFSRFRVRGKVTFLKSGRLQAQGAQIVAQLQTSRRRGRFGFSTAVYKPYRTIDNSIDIMIAALPMKGRPKTFTGAVGESFSLSVTAAKTVVKVGEPVALSIVIRGKGELSGISLPSFEEMGFDSGDFDLPTDKPIGQMSEDGSKLFESVVQIRKSSVREVPALSFSYYDGQAERYVTAESQPIALSVKGSALITANSISNSPAIQTASSETGQSLSLSGADLSLSPLGAAAAKAWTNGKAFPIAIAFYALPFGVGLMLGYRRRTESSRNDKNEIKTARKDLKAALNQAEQLSAKEAGPMLCQALKKWAALRGFNPSSLISDIEVAAYSPDSGSTVLPSTLIAQCHAVLSKKNSSHGLVIVLLIGCGMSMGLPVHSAETSDPRIAYDEALQITDRAERIRAFELSAKGFETLVADSPHSADLLTDWGNASIGAANLGQASLAFRRALSIDPRHERARRNLSWIEQQLPEWSRMEANQNPLASLLFWSSWVNPPTLLLYSSFVFAIGGLLFVFGGRKHRITVGLIALFWLSLIGSFAASSLSSEIAVVQNDAGPLRAADNSGAPPVTTEWLSPGSAVFLLRQTDQWSEVSMANGLRGWLPNRALTPVKP